MQLTVVRQILKPPVTLKKEERINQGLVREPKGSLVLIHNHIFVGIARDR